MQTTALPYIPHPTATAASAAVESLCRSESLCVHGEQSNSRNIWEYILGQDRSAYVTFRQALPV